MANNRLQLKCICGAERFLAKRFGDGYYVPELTANGGDAGYVERLNVFLTEHAWCGDGSPDHFSVSYEIPANHDYRAAADFVERAILQGNRKPGDPEPVGMVDGSGVDSPKSGVFHESLAALESYGEPLKRIERELLESSVDIESIVSDDLARAMAGGFWTLTPPTEPGWYWHHQNKATYPVQIEDQGGRGMRVAASCCDSDDTPEEYGGEWWSARIDPPRTV